MAFGMGMGKDDMRSDMRKMEEMMAKWEDMAEDMDEGSRMQMDEAMRHMHKGIDMMRDIS